MLLRPFPPPVLQKRDLPPSFQAVADELSPGGHALPIILSAMLAAASFATAGIRRARTPGALIYDHSIFSLVISPSATGKTFFLDTLLRDPAKAAVAQYLREAKPEIARLKAAHTSWTLRIKGKQSGLKKASTESEIADLEKELADLMMDEPPRVRRLDYMLPGDASCKAITTEILYEYPYAGWIAPEAMQILGEMRSGDENRLAEVWDGKQLTWTRTGREARQIDPHLTLLWMIQNDRWQAYQASPRSKRWRDSGAAARMLFSFMPKDSIADSGEIGPATRQFRDSIQSRLLESIANSRNGWADLPIVDFSRDAAACFVAIKSRYESMKRDARHAPYKDFVGRMLDHLCRVASVLAGVDANAGEIKLEHVEFAEAIVDYHFDVFRHLYAPADDRSREQTDAETLYYWLRANVKLRDSRRRHTEQELGLDNGRMRRAVSELFRLDLVQFDYAGETSLVLRRDAKWTDRCLGPGGVHSPHLL
ncbi:DUF3987 domain-containing protein [Burkholderia cepacia]|uniref:DUF3987 domain-containing protein n=1 Tax=Burkholderia cepacia TaxID=292 RepID=UPI0007539CF1|nr:DUF3987 domain-containing protein [Burkholderia cepacia]KVH31360.1 hypothetical protein WS88_28785 [Burkholderia cepacia]